MTPRAPARSPKTSKRSARREGGKSAAEIRITLNTLAEQYPDADTELHYRNPFELLVATILSAQTTDEGVNRVTPALFARYPDAADLAGAAPSEVEALIQSTGFFRQKARALLGMARALQERHAGQVPASMEALVQLPGVGRKTANVVLGHALGVPGFPVDRHVLRVGNRLGVAQSEDPEVVEQQLTAALPPSDWTRLSDTLILHGRRICKPKPLCEQCTVSQSCDFYRPRRLRTVQPGALRRASPKHPTDRAGAKAGMNADARSTARRAKSR